MSGGARRATPEEVAEAVRMIQALDAAEDPELAALDDDLREFYTKNFETHYVSKLPILIQISRQLRQLASLLEQRGQD